MFPYPCLMKAILVSQPEAVQVPLLSIVRRAALADVTASRITLVSCLGPP